MPRRGAIGRQIEALAGLRAARSCDLEFQRLVRIGLVRIVHMAIATMTLPDLPAHAQATAQKDREKWTVAVLLQPALHTSAACQGIGLR